MLLVVALVALVVPAALSHGANHRGMAGKMSGKTCEKMGPPTELYNVIAVTGSSDEAVNFNILSTAIEGNASKVLVMTPSTPRSGTYYFANDTAVLPFGNRSKGDHPRPAKTDYTNATLNVTGASAVVAWKNITRTGTGKGDFGMQFTGLITYLPGGTGKAYTLSSPVRIMKSADNSSMLIVGNPELRTALKDMLKAGGKFPAGAQPVKLKDVDAIR
ncbi:MAG TPA: hypothetical protein VLT35_00415 [Methanocella sp.]|nr:hypothetical protein [Methanocella sp.]